MKKSITLSILLFFLLNMVIGCSPNVSPAPTYTARNPTPKNKTSSELADNRIGGSAEAQAELPGYQTFVQEVRYRLIPGIW